MSECRLNSIYAFDLRAKGKMSSDGLSRVADFPFYSLYRLYGNLKSCAPMEHMRGVDSFICKVFV
jgi:hypothetical protein